MFKYPLSVDYFCGTRLPDAHNHLNVQLCDQLNLTKLLARPMLFKGPFNTPLKGPCCKILTAQGAFQSSSSWTRLPYDRQELTPLAHLDIIYIEKCNFPNQMEKLS